jgi:hypothetical protein
LTGLSIPQGYDIGKEFSAVRKEGGVNIDAPPGAAPELDMQQPPLSRGLPSYPLR